MGAACLLIGILCHTSRSELSVNPHLDPSTRAVNSSRDFKIRIAQKFKNFIIKLNYKNENELIIFISWTSLVDYLKGGK